LEKNCYEDFVGVHTFVGVTVHSKYILNCICS
jgi:hypothetical protein